MAPSLPMPDPADPALSLRGAPPRRAPLRAPEPWHQRVRDLLSTYLPLLLMLMLALGTWWLVRNTPGAAAPAEASAPRSDPDYTMQDFIVERFDKDGRLKARVQGERLRHYPDVDRIEVDQPRVRAVTDDGRILLAQARRAITNGDGSELQLLGDARVTGTGPHGEPVEFRGEFLHAFLHTERVRSHLPVSVFREGSEMHAKGMEYDHLEGLLQLQGPIRAKLLPQVPVSDSPRPPRGDATGKAP